jgi:hypothetical protein
MRIDLRYYTDQRRAADVTCIEFVVVRANGV